MSGFRLSGDDSLPDYPCKLLRVHCACSILGYLYHCGFMSVAVLAAFYLSWGFLWGCASGFGLMLLLFLGPGISCLDAP